MTNETNEIIEMSKATQEVAKTASKAIEVAEKFGTFISKYIGCPLEQAVGIFEDKLRYIRWERQERLFLRAQEFMTQEGIVQPSRPIPLKFALPLFSAASIEEDNDLQDVWAKLLVNFTNETSNIEPSRMYIDLLERLSSLEIWIISKIYLNNYDEILHNGVATRELPNNVIITPPNPSTAVLEAMNIEPSVGVKIALANLDRLGLISVSRTLGGGQHFGSLNPTFLGNLFYEACTLPSGK